MAIQYKMKVNGDRLKVTASGNDDNIEEVKRYSRAIIEACNKNQIKKALCDERELKYELSTIDTHALAEYISEYAKGVGRAAIVCNPKYLPDAKFWETVSANRGLIVKVFTSIEKAEAWLNDSLLQAPNFGNQEMS
jgi:hypothetical protein